LGLPSRAGIRPGAAIHDEEIVVPVPGVRTPAPELAVALERPVGSVDTDGNAGRRPRRPHLEVHDSLLARHGAEHGADVTREPSAETTILCTCGFASTPRR
jgi:hypothetical protein